MIRAGLWPHLGVAFAVALLVRLAYVFAFGDTLFARYLLVDAAWHDEWAQAWSRGEWRQQEAFFRAPLYPAWLSFLYTVFGHSLTTVRLVQAALGAAAVAAMAGVAWTLAGRRAFWAAMILGSLHGTLVFFDGEILIPNLLVFLLSWGLFFLVRAGDFRGVAVSAVCFGLAAAARPNVLVLLLPIAWWIWPGRGQSGSSPGGAGRWVAPALALMLAPSFYVSFLNYRAEQSAVFVSSQGGVNLYAGNHKGASGRGVDIPEFGHLNTWREFQEKSRTVAEQSADRSLSSREVSDFWVRRTGQSISSDPEEWLGLTARKIYYLLNAYETPNNRDLYGNSPWVLKPLLWTTPVFSVPWGYLFPLAVLGLVALWRNHRRPATLLLLWLGLYGLSVVLFFVCARFRMGLMPALVVAAAVPFGLGLGRLPRSAWIAAAAALVLTNTGFWGVRDQSPSQELVKLATLQLESGDVHDGIRTLQRAVELNPDNVTATYLLADSYYDLGDLSKSVELFQDVVRSRPDDPRVRLTLGTAYLGLDRPQDAIPQLESASRLKPQDPTAWANLGTAYEALHQNEQAAAAFARALEANPKLVKAYMGYAVVLTRMQQPKQATALLVRGIQEVPESVDLWLALSLAHVELEEWEQALAAAREARRRDPRDSRIEPLLREIQERN